MIRDLPKHWLKVLCCIIVIVLCIVVAVGLYNDNATIEAPPENNQAETAETGE